MLPVFLFSSVIRMYVLVKMYTKMRDFGYRILDLDTLFHFLSVGEIHICK